MKEKKGKITIITLILIILALISFCGYLLYDKYNNKLNNTNNNYLTFIEGEEVKVESKTAELIEYNDYYALYNDNGLKLYIFKTNEIRKIKDIEITDDIYFVLLKEGFIYYKNINNKISENSGYYSIELNTILFKDKYDMLWPIYPDYPEWVRDTEPISYALQASKNNKIYVIDISTQKEIIEEEDAHWPQKEEGDYARQFKHDFSGQAHGFFVSYYSNGGHEYGYTLYLDDGTLVKKLKDNEYYRIINIDYFTALDIYTENENEHLWY